VFNLSQPVATYLARREREIAKGYNGNGGGITLALAVRTWPTPVTSDAKGSRKSTARTDGWKSNDGDTLLDACWKHAETEPQQLNPEWVESLMGFPPGWTDVGPVDEVPIKKRGKRRA
jgi:hypothetical protein